MNFICKSWFFFLSLSLFLQIAAIDAKPFITADLRYELGNQMFQVAAAVAIAEEHDYEACFPDLANIPFWGMPDNWKYVFWRLNSQKPEGEIEYVFQDNGALIPPVPNMKISGLFQSEKYFIRHKDKILEIFAPSPDMLEYLNKKYGDILAHPCTVGVHVRTFHKDYGHLPTKDEVHWFAGVEYYEKAVKFFPPDALFVVCSDDVPWCKKHLAHIAPNIVFIEGNTHCHDMYLLSLCHHNITANSTFSWWSAYLNQHPDKIVVTLDNWFGQWWKGQTNKVVLKDWIQISRGER